MATRRSRLSEIAVALAACTAAWVIGVTLFYGSGDWNLAGLVPSLGTLLALWGALRSDRGLMMLGTGVVAIASAAFVFSLGFVLIPAAVVLIVGCFVLSSDRQTTV